MLRRISIYLKLSYRYLKYYFTALTRYDVHSPFVYELVEEVLEDRRNYYAFPIIEQLRGLLLRNRRTIAIKDLGAGSLASRRSQRTVRSLARHSAIPPAVGKLLFRLVRWHRPATMLELGTSLGISTAYQAAAALKANFHTIEGCPQIAQIAKENFQQLNLPGPRLLNGAFSEILPGLLSHLKQVDYVYFDGDHRKAPTLSYFRQCLPYTHSNSLFVVGDIHWSGEMEEAWDEMRRQPGVSLSIDLFHLGLLFFRKENREKEHYVLIRAALKPWRMGFFAKR